MDHKRIVVLCTVPNSTKGAEIAQTLVTEKLAACVNIVDKLRSVYWWDGAVCDDSESQLIIKTRIDRFEKLRKRIISLHPYDTPEVIALPIVEGHEAYLDWIDASLERD
jgi:periplasmic divalent cation tolerance protein